MGGSRTAEREIEDNGAMQQDKFPEEYHSGSTTPAKMATPEGRSDKDSHSCNDGDVSGEQQERIVVSKER